jgi:uncharacterized repeat protein (TIGR01451 family)/LPXTG-motif cell wall-anchored protein
MSKLINALKRFPKRAGAAVAIVAAAIIVPATLFAWGPSRATFTEQNPAPYITFNSITNNSFYGDERNFVTVKDASNTQDGGWVDNLTVQPGKEYVVRMYVHNNAADNLNLVAKNVRASASVPTTTGKSVPISGFINADNSEPKQVWDDIRLNSDKDFNLAFVPGSATWHNNGIGKNPEGAKLPDSIVTSAGAKLGYNELNGEIPGCFKYGGYVYFKVKPQFAPSNNFEPTKQVRKAGETAWQKSVNANPGDTVEYQLTYKNTGDTRQNNILIQDYLPTGITYIDGSTYLKNGTNPNGLKVSDNVTKPVGINVGDYNPGAAAYVKFSAKVGNNDSLPNCGPNKLTNKVRVTADGGYKEDTADVNVPKECKPEAKYSCDSLKVTKIERTKFKFETKYTAENVTLKKIEYVIRNEQGAEIARQTSADYTQTTVGKYSVEAIVTVTVDGQDKVAPGDCKQPFEVVKENTPAIQIDKKVDGVEHKQVGVNQEFTYQIVVTNTGEVDLKDAVVTDKAPNGVTFIKASAGVIANNAWTYTIGELKVGQATSFTITAKVPAYLAGKIVNTVCVDAPQVPGNPDDCDDASVEVPKTPETPCVPGKDAECTKTPETPTELPKTGADDGIIALIGASSLIAAIGYYIASRRALS